MSIGFRQRSLPVANAISNSKSWTIGVLTMVITFGELGASAAFVFVSCYSFTFFVILESPSWSVWCMHMSLSLGIYSRTIWNIISASSTFMYQLWTCLHLGLQKPRAVCPVSQCRWAIASCFLHHCHATRVCARTFTHAHGATREKKISFVAWFLLLDIFACRKQEFQRKMGCCF